MNATRDSSFTDFDRPAGCFPSHHLALAAMCATLLGGCAGSGLVKKPVPLESGPPLATACDEQVCVDVAWVIVRDGPGSWAKKANWDEYLLNVRNLTAAPLDIEAISLYDSMGYRIASGADRAELVSGSKKTVKRYKDSKLKVEAGIGAGTMAATGGVLAAGGVGAAYAAVMAAPMGGAGGAVALGLGVAAVGPVLIVGSVVRAVNNGKVNDEILRRQTNLPAALTGQDLRELDVFFPFAPSPSHVEITYESGGTARILSVDTSDTLAGLHLQSKKRDDGSPSDLVSAQRANSTP